MLNIELIYKLLLLISIPIIMKQEVQFSSLKNYAEFRNLPHILRIEDWNADAIEMVRWFLHPQTYLEMLFAKILHVILRDWMH